MANTNSPFGFRPVGKVGQNADNQGLSQYNIASASSTSIFQGDLVKMTGTGYIDQSGASDPSLGVFWGAFISKDPSTGKPKYTNYYTDTTVAAGQTIEAFVYDDPYARFEVQADDGAIAQADVGLNFDINVGTGSTINGQSEMTLDVGTSATTALLVRVIGFSKDPSNSIGAYAKTIVTINEHQLKSTTGV